MIEKKIDKPLRARSMKEMNERIKFAKEAGYEQIGGIVENANNIYQAFMRKTIYWEER